MPKLRRFQFILASLVLTAAANAGHARIWLSYEIDTLADKSALIVEAQVIAITDAKTGQVQVRVSQVHRGTDAKTDDTLLINAGDYKKPGANFFQGKPLEVGDRLFWFLQLPPDGTPADRPVWNPLPGGAKLIFNDHVAEFSQQMNPGDPIAEIEPSRAPKNQPTLEEYRQRIVASIRDMSQLRNDVSAALSARDSKQLLAILRQRVKTTADRPGWADQFESLIESSLASLHDYDALADAWSIPGRPGGPWNLRPGFVTPEGIDYLLTHIADKQLLQAQRLAYLDMLPPIYEFQNPDGTLRPGGFYFARLAKLAIDNAQNTDLAAYLINFIQSGSARQKLDRAGQQGQEDAIALLKGLYDSTTDERLRYAIEFTTHETNLDFYAKLNSKCGPIICIATVPVDLRTYQKPPGRDIIAGLQYSFFFPEEGNYTVQDQPILESIATGKTYPTTFNTAGSFDPAEIKCSNGSRSSLTALIAVPPEAPAGKYRLYFEIKHENKLISQSHAVEVTIAAEKP